MRGSWPEFKTPFELGGSMLILWLVLWFLGGIAFGALYMEE